MSRLTAVHALLLVLHLATTAIGVYAVFAVGWVLRHVGATRYRRYWQWVQTALGLTVAVYAVLGLWLLAMPTADHDQPLLALVRLAVLAMLLLLLHLYRMTVEELQAADSLSQTIVATAAEGIVVLEADGRVRYVNPRMADLLGVTAESLVGQPVVTLVVPDMQATIRTQLALRQQGQEGQFDIQFLRPDGNTFWGIISGAPLLDQAKRYVGMIGMVTEINARKAAECSLARTKSLLQATIESTADAILVVDLSGRFILYNEKFRELWRLPAPILESGEDGQALRYVLDQLTDPDQFLSQVQALYADPERESLDVLTFRDGRLVQRYSQAQRLGGTVVGRVWSFRDITRIEASSRLKSEFISLASHELRTPITIMQGYLDLLQQADAMGFSPERRTTMLAAAHKQVLRLGHIVQDLLNVTRIEQGHHTFTPRPIALEDLIADVVADLAPLAAKREMTIHGPSPAEPLPQVHADPEHVAQILTNLLDNAIKYGAPGHRVDLSAVVAGRYVRLAVTDYGIGIPATEWPRLFHKFHRIATPIALKERGSGLGLYLSRQLAEMQGGILLASSDPGRETTFAFTLPIVAADAVELPLAA